MRARWTISSSLLIAGGVVACSGVDLFHFDLKDPPDTGSSSSSCNRTGVRCWESVDCFDYVDRRGLFDTAECWGPGTCGADGYCAQGAALTSPRKQTPPIVPCNPQACDNGRLYYGLSADGEACTSTGGLPGTCASGSCVVTAVDADVDAALTMDAATDADTRALDDAAADADAAD